MRRPLPTKEQILYWLSCHPESGEFYWIREPKAIGSALGRKAGTANRRYHKTSIPGMYQVGTHTLMWIVCRGPIPDGMEIDHIDGNPSNNRLNNLRLATSQQQKHNKGVQSNNRSGLKGAFYHACRPGKKWRSQIKAPGKRLIFLGYFDTPLEAHAAYCAAAKKYFGEFACTEPSRSIVEIEQTIAAKYPGVA